ncbi:hypothetical protein [Aliarcobacter butzleri]|uniref:hypothetical protein n=1 Tax=Aliarcobacter butzleri TaxID=28197 RepID=UPI001EDB2922|nr:hypothetical protein [Aliarcobacter butzleri]MCG3692493.1 hypothetical protein [Aliarcobacter butzleri]
MAEKTKNARISSWVYNLFSDKASKEDSTLLKKIDELAETLHLLNINEVVLNNFLNQAYKEDETNTSRYVFETLNALMNYYDKLNNNLFNKYSFNQFIDRWNIVAYYISSHVYTNVLATNALSEQELRQRAESTMALAFLFDKDVTKAIEYTKEIMEEIDPYKNAYISKKNKSLIMTKIFMHEKLLELLQSELMIRKENAISVLFNHLANKYNLKKEGVSAFTISLESIGIPNKIAYMIYLQYKYKKLNELPYFVNEHFLSDLFCLLHSYMGSYHSSDLYHTKTLESAFKISQAIKSEDAYNYDNSYLKGNLQNSNYFNNLDDALQADINTLEATRYTYSAEMRMRTPMHIVKQTTNTGTRYVLKPEIKKVILENLINICYPIYFYIIQMEGEILQFNDNDKKTEVYSKDKSAFITISMGESFYYTNLILHINDEDKLLSTITINMDHSSLEKIYHCIHMERTHTTKIEDNLTFYYDSKDSIRINYTQGSIFLHGKIKDSFIEVINKYVESDDFIKNKELDISNYGLI